MRSECTQGPPAIEVERWWLVFMKDKEWMHSRSTCIWSWKMMVGLCEGWWANVLKVQLRLEDVVSIYKGRGVNSLKVHQQLRLKDGGQSLWHEWSEWLTPGQAIRKTEYVNPGSIKRVSLCCWAKSILMWGAGMTNTRSDHWEDRICLSQIQRKDQLEVVPSP